MKSQLKASLLSSSAVIGAALLTAGTPVFSQELDSSSPYGDSLEYIDPMLEDTTNLDSVDSMSQVTNVNQLRDVSPADWAFEALRSLVDRYGCIVGYPDQTYRGNNALSRYEFAAGLNACLNQIERLIAASEAVLREDIEVINRLIQEFEAELAALTGRVDNLEGRVAFLEDNQFSTTTKLVGEVAFTLADAWGNDTDAQTVFTDKVRLQLVSSFTGKDKLFTRLTAGNIANSFQDELGTREGRFAFDGPANNNIVIDRLHYVFNVGDKLRVTTMASLAAHHFYTDTFNAGIDVGGGANGPLGRFAERNPLFRHTINRNSVGAGATYKFTPKFELSAGYIARNGSDPQLGNGLFNGTFSALGQLIFKPADKFKFGVAYLRGYDDNAGATLWGGTGTNLASGSALNGEALTSDSVGGQFQWDVSSKVSIRGWFGYTSSQTRDTETDQETLTYAAVVALPDLGKEGNLGGFIVGAEPYVTSIDGRSPDTNDVPIHLEAFYRYQINDNISITPGLIGLINSNQDSDNDGIVIGAIRTTFKF